MQRPLARLVLLVALSSAWGGVAAPALAAETGSISGAIVAPAAGFPAPDVAGMRSNVRIVARTEDGAGVGSVTLAAAEAPANGLRRIPFTISGVPLGVPVHVAAERVVPAAPSPLPSGFFWTFVVQKIGGDPSTPDYLVTLDAAHQTKTGCDFSYGQIEVPPALPH